ncbi:MAG: tetratricopeptide repeat protein [Verrucomicrobiae bacterium]|nr:tetratricopeptide repeat protein [Verrucomicrobiae bacterium]
MNDSPNRESVVFTEAIHLPVAERAAYLTRACGDDAGLRQRVESLLQVHERVGDFLEQPPQNFTTAARSDGVSGEKPGDRIGRYKLLQQIGEGGCGVVYMAEQEEPVRRRVALKIIKPGMDTKSVIARFEAERQALALMEHPNIAKVFDAGATGSGRPYFVMELVRGVKITEYCDQNSLTTEERLKLFIEVCRAVQHAHQKGIIHRDIKPSNILVTTTVEGAALPVVIDFGIAKATTNQRLTDKTLFTAFEMLIGTPAYMSPEQAALASVEVDTRTDIYSLGVLLYELLTGSTPFDAGELLKAGLDEIRRVIREQEPVCPSTRLSKLTGADLTTIAQCRRAQPPALIRAVRGDLDWIAMKALEKDRTRRYETANGLALDVQRFLTDETVAARPPSTLYRFQKTVLRHKLIFGGISIIALLLVTSLVVVSGSLAKERQARREADGALKQAEADKAKAQTEAVKSEQVTQFLEEMLQGAGPSIALGRDTTMLREILDKAAIRVGKELTNQPATMAELQNKIGNVYEQLACYDQAEAMHRTALAGGRKLFGNENQEVAASLSGLGLVLLKQGKLAEAEKSYREALAIRQKLLGNEHPAVATTMKDLSGVFWKEGRLTEAAALNQAALEMRRRLLGSENLDVADSLNAVGLILDQQGKLSEAETTERQVLAMRRKLLGTEHPLIASSLHNLAMTLAEEEKLDEAESTYRETLAMRYKLYGEEHPDVASTLSGLGQVLLREGKLDEAATVSSNALSIQHQVFGNEHPGYIHALYDLGLILESRGEYPKAETADREVLAWQRKNLGDEDSQVRAALDHLVAVLVAEKKFKAAEQLLNDFLTPALVAKPQSAYFLAARAKFLARQSRWPEAAADTAAALQYCPTDHQLYHMLAPLLVEAKSLDAYRQLCQKILGQFRGTTDPFIADQMAKDCLLLPSSDADLRLVGELAETAVAAGSDHPAMPYFQCCKALAEYRLGHFNAAIEWAQKSVTEPYPDAQGMACFILAMAQFRLTHNDEAKSALDMGAKLVQSKLPQRGSDDLGVDWQGWVFAQVLMAEATGLIGSTPSTEQPSTK